MAPSARNHFERGRRDAGALVAGAEELARRAQVHRALDDDRQVAGDHGRDVGGLQRPVAGAGRELLVVHPDVEAASWRGPL